MREPAPGNFGAHIARIVGEAVVHAVTVLLPVHHAERIRAHQEWAEGLADDLHGGLAPMLQHLLDTEAVHPVIEPVIRRIVEKK